MVLKEGSGAPLDLIRVIFLKKGFWCSSSVRREEVTYLVTFSKTQVDKRFSWIYRAYYTIHCLVIFLKRMSTFQREFVRNILSWESEQVELTSGSKDQTQTHTSARWAHIVFVLEIILRDLVTGKDNAITQYTTSLWKERRLHEKGCLPILPDNCHWLFKVLWAVLPRV